MKWPLRLAWPPVVQLVSGGRLARPSLTGTGNCLRDVVSQAARRRAIALTMLTLSTRRAVQPHAWHATSPAQVLTPAHFHAEPIAAPASLFGVRCRLAGAQRHRSLLAGGWRFGARSSRSLVRSIHLLFHRLTNMLRRSGMPVCVEKADHAC